MLFTHHSDDRDENDDRQKGERARRTRIDVRMTRLIDFNDVQHGNDKHETRVELKVLSRWTDVITTTQN